MATPEENRRRIAGFYGAFAARDGDAMAAHYAPDGTFEDPAFGKLSGAEAGDMWRMLTGRAADLQIELTTHDASDAAGTADWTAHYTFATTGRPVVNHVRATFRFAPDGRFGEHRDDFSFHAWSRQALGPAGALLGWTPLLRAATQRKARAQLQVFRDAR